MKRILEKNEKMPMNKTLEAKTRWGAVSPGSE
jgi:hypothetical protein